MNNESPSIADELAELRRKFLELEDRYAKTTARLDAAPSRRGEGSPEKSIIESNANTLDESALNQRNWADDFFAKRRADSSFVDVCVVIARRVGPLIFYLICAALVVYALLLNAGVLDGR